MSTATSSRPVYADMGHFGTRPIRVDWFAVVLPALLLNYFGQGALLLQHPAAAENPFYLLAPSWAICPLILLAVAAAIIASQAVISGAFSMMQAVQLGFSPRIRIDHTSRDEYGQIYIAAVNWALMVGCIVIVLGFRTSSNLAAAYGVAVTSTMVITTVLFFVVARERFAWRLVPAIALAIGFLIVDLAFFGANIIKIGQGGWFPLVLAGLVFVLLTTWKRGRRIMSERIQAEARPLEDFVRDTLARPLTRVPGTAIFMNGTASRTPSAMLHNLAAQQGAARARSVRDRQDAPGASCRGRRQARDRGSRERAVPCEGLLRLHGPTGHPGCAALERGPGTPAAGSGRHDVFPWARNHHCVSATRHGVVAGAAVCVAVAQRHNGDGLHGHSAGPRRRTGGQLEI